MEEENEGGGEEEEEGKEEGGEEREKVEKKKEMKKKKCKKPEIDNRLESVIGSFSALLTDGRTDSLSYGNILKED